MFTICSYFVHNYPVYYKSSKEQNTSHTENRAVRFRQPPRKGGENVKRVI